MKIAVKKIHGSYIMDGVVLPTLTWRRLRGPNRLALYVSDHGNYCRQFCCLCGLNERGDVFQVRARPAGGTGRGEWICDRCAEKWAPELYEEAEKKNAEFNASRAAEEAQG